MEKNDQRTTNCWFAVCCKPRQEVVAKDNLVRQDFHVYLPRIQYRRRRRGQWVDVVEALFPRYLFMWTDPMRRNLAPTAAISGPCQFSFGSSTRSADLAEFDIAEHLDSEQARAEYLTVVLEENDPAACAQKQRGCRSTLWSEAPKLTQVAA